MRIEGLAAGPLRPTRRAASREGFRLPGEDAAAVGEATRAEQAGAIGPVAAREEGAARDRQAERRATALLDALAMLQVALLEGRAAPAALEALAMQAEGEAAADPALVAVMAGIALRARVELARRRMQATTATNT